MKSFQLQPADYEEIIEKALKEDLGDLGDITSDAIFANERGSAVIRAKQNGVLAGIEIVKAVFRRVDAESEIENLLNDSARFTQGDVVLRLSGRVRSLLRAERTALNFLGRLSGIATLTSKYVAAVKGTSCKILDTRKTTPGWRKLEKYAVRMGGGFNHRMGLFDMVLIKDNHIAAAGGIAPAIARVRDYLHKRKIMAAIEVEVTNLTELQVAISHEVDRIMLDNMTLDQMREAVAICGGKIPLEASGNVTLQRVGEIARTGVDFISVGALTHSAPVCDFSMKMV